MGALSFGNFQASSTSVGVTSTLVVGRNTGRKCLRAADLTTGGYVSCTFNNSTSSAVLNKGIIFGTNTTTTLNFAIGCGLTDIRTEDFQCVANTTSTISWTQD